MDRRFLTVLAVSLVFALVVSSVFYQMTARSSSGNSEPAAPPEEIEVVVASRPLGVGVMIKAPDIKLAKYPRNAVPKGSFTKPEEVIDRPLISNVLVDEPVLEGRLAAKGSGMGLAPTIPVGMRAITVRVNDVAGVAGFVLPGMHVDVLVTGKPPEGDDQMTNTVLQNMLVLSAGKELQPDANGNAMPTPTVTLMGTPEEAETLTLANNRGQIQLVLRNSSDQAMAKTSGSYEPELYRGHGHRPEPAPQPRVRPEPKTTAIAPPPPPPAALEVIVIRGTQRTVQVVGKPLPEAPNDR